MITRLTEKAEHHILTHTEENPLEDKISSFIRDLSAYRRSCVFNPWGEEDTALDVAGAAAIRRRQLSLYLERRIGRARVLFLAEACGYQGGRFSGIAMTCERMLLSRHPSVTAEMVLGAQGVRTSRADSAFPLKETQRKDGFNEPTDTVVWGAAAEAGLVPEEFLLWNIFPFHPHQKGAPLTNRTPTEAELADGLWFAKSFLALAGPVKIFAVGKKSEETLRAAGYDVIGLRHPANGGARQFREGLLAALGAGIRKP